MNTHFLFQKRRNLYAKALSTTFLILVSVTLQAQQTYSSATNQTVTPVVVNFMDQVSEYNANPPTLTPELKTPNNPTKFPENPMPLGISANVFAGQPKISGVGNQSQSQNPVSNPPSPAPSVGFTAIIDNGVTIPPDVAGAVGPNHVMTTLNNGLMIQDKTGGGAVFINDNTFFTVEVGNSIFDPKVFYDKYTQRYYFIDLNGSSPSSTGILLAVSQTNDPTGNWNQYRFQSNAGAGESNIWFDYPMVGYNKDWLVISGNMFTSGGSFSTAKIFILKKSDVLAGLTTTPFEFSPAGSTISPAIVDDNTTDYIPLIGRWNTSTGTYKVSKITGTVTPALSDIGFPSVSSANSWLFRSNISNDGPQKDMTSQTDGLATNDSRMGQSLLKNGKLWVAHSAFLSSVVSGATIYRGAAQWLSVNPNTAAVNEWGRVVDNTSTSLGAYSVPTNSFAFPSIAVNDNDDILLNFAHFSPNHYPSASYAFRPSGNANFDDVYLYKAGVEHYYKTFGGSRNRWGDYTLAMVDPVNGLDFWAIGEYSETSIGSGSSSDRWATYWAKVATAVPNTITINSIANDTLCAEKNYNMNFTTAGTYNVGNSFTAQLSNTSGSFASPVTVGTLSGTAAGILITNVPASILGGSGYKLRITSSNPIVASSNTTDVTIVRKDLAINGITPSPTEATDTITAENLTISGNQKYRAGKSITLIATPSSSVSTTNGTVFEAKIVGCPY